MTGFNPGKGTVQPFNRIPRISYSVFGKKNKNVRMITVFQRKSHAAFTEVMLPFRENSCVINPEITLLVAKKYLPGVQRTH